MSARPPEPADASAWFAMWQGHLQYHRDLPTPIADCPFCFDESQPTDGATVGEEPK